MQGIAHSLYYRVPTALHVQSLLSENWGRHSSSTVARSAKQASTSDHTALPPRLQGHQRLSHLCDEALIKMLSLVSARLLLDSALSSKALSSEVMNRSTFLSVCLRW